MYYSTRYLTSIVLPVHIQHTWYHIQFYIVVHRTRKLVLISVLVKEHQVLYSSSPSLGTSIISNYYKSHWFCWCCTGQYSTGVGLQSLFSMRCSQVLYELLNPTSHGIFPVQHLHQILKELQTQSQSYHLSHNSTKHSTSNFTYSFLL